VLPPGSWIPPWHALRFQKSNSTRSSKKPCQSSCLNAVSIRKILYGPLKFGGASFRSLYVHQGTQQTLLFLKDWRNSTIAGCLLQIAVSWFQVQIGVSYSFLKRVDTDLPHLELKWLASLRQFLSTMGASFQLYLNVILAPMQRMHDFNVMEDIILESRKFSPSEICRLNFCRLYLQATTLSDLTQTNGQHLDPNKVEGTFSHIWGTQHNTPRQ
jgi:hypothetical protein